MFSTSIPLWPCKKKIKIFQNTQRAPGDSQMTEPCQENSILTPEDNQFSCCGGRKFQGLKMFELF